MRKQLWMIDADLAEWKKSSTGDKSENYLEDWYTDRNNILKAY